MHPLQKISSGILGHVRLVGQYKVFGLVSTTKK